MNTTLYSEGLDGISGIPIIIEVNIAEGLPKFDVVGLPDQSVSESRERVIAAMLNSKRFFPPKRITINLAPASIRKTGGLYDLPIALGILLSSVQIFNKVGMNEFVIMGELALDGSVRHVRGVFSMLMNAKKLGIKKAIIPFDNIREASILSDIEIYGVKNLNEAVSVLEGDIECSSFNESIDFETHYDNSLDFEDIKGQEYAKRAAMVSAAGSHNFIMVGSPGSGKTLIAKALKSIMPPLTFEESIEITNIYSTQGMLEKNQSLIVVRPFRSPHHTASYASLIGGGHNIKAGEITLAHNGILFLDEFTEFQNSVLQTLREPLEENAITINRASGSVKFPANFTLIAAMNPCPCGYYGDTVIACKCSSNSIKRYNAKVSGPLLDRIDIVIEVRRLPHDKLTQTSKGGMSSKEMREIIKVARTIQAKRFKSLDNKIFSNAAMGLKEVNMFATLETDAKDILNLATKKFNITARGYDKILKVARTISDLDESENIKGSHISEALHYRVSHLT